MRVAYRTVMLCPRARPEKSDEDSQICFEIFFK